MGNLVWYDNRKNKGIRQGTMLLFEYLKEKQEKKECAELCEIAMIYYYVATNWDRNFHEEIEVKKESGAIVKLNHGSLMLDKLMNYTKTWLFNNIKILCDKKMMTIIPIINME